MTVYIVVSESEYSSDIKAVFSSQEKAENYIVACVEKSDLEIKEYLVDELSQKMEMGLAYYGIKMKKNGQVENAEQLNPDLNPDGEETCSFYGWGPPLPGEREGIYFCCWAKSQKEAEQRASARRLDIIQKNEWSKNIPGWELWNLRGGY